MRLLNQSGINGATLLGVALTIFALRNEVNLYGNSGYFVFVTSCFIFLVLSIIEFSNISE